MPVVMEPVGALAGTGLGPFAAAAVSLASGIPLTIQRSEDAGQRQFDQPLPTLALLRQGHHRLVNGGVAEFADTG